MRLYTYFQSSGAYRVRIALALKGIKADLSFINLRKDEHLTADYATVNPQQLVPSFIDGDGNVLTQSLAIIEYLEERFPQPPLLPQSPVERANVRAIALAVACDIAPINNLKVRKHIKSFHLDENEWVRNWIHEGLWPLEKMLATSAGKFCHGATPTMADCVLIPQLYNAKRWRCDLTGYPTLMRIDAACAKHPAFIAAHPDNQQDAV